jgi:hypothetical protein
MLKAIPMVPWPDYRMRFYESSVHHPLALDHAQAMDRWTALAMLESGGDDRTVGPAGEVSRYQIRSELWPGGDPLDTRVALANAQHIIAPRLAAFEKSHGRAADDFEFYILWNAPAQINHPRPAVVERARRFANLVALPAQPSASDSDKPRSASQPSRPSGGRLKTG